MRKLKDSIHMYVTKDEKEFAKKKAAEMGMNVSTYIRYLIQKEMEKK